MSAVLNLSLDGSSLKPAEVDEVARRRARVTLSEAALTRLKRTRAVVDRLVKEERVVYGLTTGVGALRTTRIAPEDVRTLQRNLLMSHAVGVGPPMPEELVRAGILVRVNQFCQGTSGVRPEVAQALLDLLNHDIYPWVPEKGSLGASGDLAPSAHFGLVLIGEGQVIANGESRPGAEALRLAGLSPLRLEAKDALSILNGTHFMTGAAALLLADARRLLRTADMAVALSLEALRGTRTAFDPRVHAARPHPGQAESAARIWRLTEGSEIVQSHVLCDRVQDAYSLRCAAQVHGASADALDYLRRVVEVELNAGTDNPMVFEEGPSVISGGNFHGQPLALALDTAAIALSELGSISERRLFRLLTEHLSDLPPFLTRHSGVNSGYMLLQYTAAALVTENQLLSAPASVHSLPTSADQEDHNSMGWHAALKARRVAENVETILALEALAAAQGIDLLAPLKPSRRTGSAHALIRKRVPPLEQDRILAPEIQAAISLVHEGALAHIADEPQPAGVK
jgi:histidine ammonia-lyase